MFQVIPQLLGPPPQWVIQAQVLNGCYGGLFQRVLCRIQPEKGIGIGGKVEPGSQQAGQAWMPVQGVVVAAGRLTQVIEQLTREFVHPVLSLCE
jgi:hypothetical protein